MKIFDKKKERLYRKGEIVLFEGQAHYILRRVSSTFKGTTKYVGIYAFSHKNNALTCSRVIQRDQRIKTRLKCGYKWKSRVPQPCACPDRKNRKWDEPRKRPF